MYEVLETEFGGNSRKNDEYFCTLDYALKRLTALLTMAMEGTILANRISIHIQKTKKIRNGTPQD